MLLSGLVPGLAELGLAELGLLELGLVVVCVCELPEFGFVLVVVLCVVVVVCVLPVDGIV